MDYGFGNQYTSYGPQGGAGGGGFLPGDGSQSSQTKGNKGSGQDSLRPVTIKQLNDAEPLPGDKEFKSDGVELDQVTFVGQVRNIVDQQMNITYKFDDGTGFMEVRFYKNTDAPGPLGADALKAKVTENLYARVWGRLRLLNGKPTIFAHIIRPVQDFNEVSCHLLEATAVHLQLTQGPPQGANKDGASGDLNGQQAGYNSMQGVVAGDKILSPAAKRVLSCLRSTPQSNEGLHAQDIARRLGMEVGDVMKSGDELVNAGTIYTTVDDLTWAVLEI